MQRTRGMLGSVLAILFALVLSLMLLTTVTHDMGTAPRMMQGLMQRHAPPEMTGLPAADYSAMAEMITSYLRGTTEQFQYVYTVEGSEYLAFHDYEQAHMDDVRGLFGLCRMVGYASVFAMPLLAVLSAMAAGPRRFIRWAQAGLLAVLALITAAAVWAAVDFNSLFLLFHRIAFTNDLWLLNPWTDMLIRLMPAEFFVSYAAAIAGIWLVLMLAALTALELLCRFGRTVLESIMSKRR